MVRPLMYMIKLAIFLEDLLQTSREVVLEVYTEKTKYMVVFHHHTVGKVKMYWLLINPLKFGKVQVRGNNSKKLNWIHEQIKSTLKSRNACYHFVQALLMPTPL
jgi:hypothetical protein